MVFSKENNIETELFNSEYPRHIEKFLSKEPLDSFDAVIGFGGDGTFNEIISGLHRRENKNSLSVGLIPFGTGNDFLRSLGSLNPFIWAKNIVKGKTKEIDIIEVKAKEKTYFSQLLAGWGVFYDGAIAAEKYRFLGLLNTLRVPLSHSLKAKEKRQQLKSIMKCMKITFGGP